MIVVTTPTGRIGARVVAREPDRLPAAVRDQVDVVAGSHLDEGVLARAFADADTLFWLVPPDPRAASVADH